MMVKVTDNQINHPPQLLIYIKHVVGHKSTFSENPIVLQYQQKTLDVHTVLR